MLAMRIKEFGIRKVLGATMIQIITLHASYFIRIVIIANLFALPVAYWLMDVWLSDFAYRTTISGFVLWVVIGSSFMLVRFRSMQLP